MYHSVKLSLLTILLMSLNGCNEKASEEPLIPDIIGLEISNAPTKSYALNKYTLDVYTLYTSDYDNNSTEYVRWEISDTQVGVMDAVLANQYLANAKSGIQTLNVIYKTLKTSVEIENIALSTMNITLLDANESNLSVNSTYQFDLNATYEDNTSSEDIIYSTPLINQVLWESNDSEIATVENGLITTVSVGDVRISARAFENYTIEKNGADEVNTTVELRIQ